MIKTGIFSGSFNPIHIGHLALANWLCEYEELDEVWFVVTPQNPLKKQEDLMDDHLRLVMVEAAIQGYAKFKISSIEYNLPKPSYTIDTLEALEKKYPDHSFHLIIGADNWHLISRWKEYQKILTNYPVWIYPRAGYEVVIPADYPFVRQVYAPLMEISSTFIRTSFQQGKDVRFFLPEAIRHIFRV